MEIYYETGPDFLLKAEGDGIHPEYTISEIDHEPGGVKHIAKIVVYGDKELRDKILKFLNED